jgi:hypothetical protein
MSPHTIPKWEATMRKSNEAGVFRRNITLPREFVDRMAELRELTGVQSDSELIRRSVKLLEKVIENGGTVTVTDPKTATETKIVVI